MKKMIIPGSLLAFVLGLWEQSQPQPRWYILLGCLGFFMYGAWYLNSKIPHKEDRKDEFEDRR